jgi:hypothetical protein
MFIAWHDAHKGILDYILLTYEYTWQYPEPCLRARRALSARRQQTPRRTCPVTTAQYHICSKTRPSRQ